MFLVAAQIKSFGHAGAFLSASTKIGRAAGKRKSADGTSSAATAADRAPLRGRLPQFARNAAIFGPSGAMPKTPLRWPFGPPISADSTGVPAAFSAASVRLIHSAGKTWSPGA